MADKNETEYAKVALNSETKEADEKQNAVVSIPNDDEDDDEDPKDFLALSIATTLCCCFVFGIVAVISSVKSREAKRVDDMERAKKFSNFAKLFNVIGIVVGAILIISITIYAINTIIETVKNNLNSSSIFALG